MVTDKQIEAVAKMIWKDSFPKIEIWSRTSKLNHELYRNIARALLEAAEAAAWCDDIGQAPRDGTRFLAVLDNALGARVLYHWRRDMFHEDDGTDDPWEHGSNSVKRWRHLPQPPVRDEKMEGE